MRIRSADRNVWTRRRLLSGAASGLAGFLALGRAPALSQTSPKKLVMAHIVAPPESSAVAFAEMAEGINKLSEGLEIEFHAGTLLTKELEVINAVKSGNIAIGDPGGAAATVFPEMGVFLVPYLVKSYDQAYKMFNGAIGDRLDRQFQDKYKLKVLCFYDYGFRHFWNNRRPITAPKDLRGMKLRVQPAKVFADTINGLTPQQQKLLLDASRTAQERIRGLTESVDTPEQAKALLEPKGMTVNTADVEAFRKVAQEKVWPQYQKEYSELWDEIVATKV